MVYRSLASLFVSQTRAAAAGVQSRPVTVYPPGALWPAGGTNVIDALQVRSYPDVPMLTPSNKNWADVPHPFT